MLSEKIRRFAEEVDALVSEYESSIEILRNENIQLTEEVRSFRTENLRLQRETRILVQRLSRYEEV